MTKEQIDEKLSLSSKIKKEPFDYKDALLRLVYNAKYVNFGEIRENISYKETENEIEIKIGRCVVLGENPNKIEDIDYQRAYSKLMELLINNTLNK